MNALRLYLLMNPAALDNLAGQVTSLDKLVLLDRGAELLLDAERIKHLVHITDAVYCARPDRLARGLPLATGVTDIGDNDLVTLVAERPQILSWT
mgnify:CR=1 FL=1